MTEEPYRWLEAVANRREYVREQLKGGSPALAASLPDGILLLAVGSGQSKVFELFDRHALAGLGHPADIEKIRQAAIDAAELVIGLEHPGGAPAQGHGPCGVQVFGHGGLTCGG